MEPRGLDVRFAKKESNETVDGYEKPPTISEARQLQLP